VRYEAWQKFNTHNPKKIKEATLLILDLLYEVSKLFTSNQGHGLKQYMPFGSEKINDEELILSSYFVETNKKLIDYLNETKDLKKSYKIKAIEAAMKMTEYIALFLLLNVKRKA